MLTRRNFIKSASVSMLTLPLISCSELEKQKSVTTEFPLEDDPQYWQKIKKMFPIPEGETYFNNGTLGVQPNFVLETVIEHMKTNAETAAQTDYAGNGPLLISGYAPFLELREKLANMVNADAKEISLTQNATMGMNFVSNGLEIKPGDEIINTNQEHPGGRCGWELLTKRKNAVLKQVEMPVPANDPQEIIDRIKNAITSKTRVIAIPHIISRYGVILPVKEICASAREQGIFTIIDAAHSIGQIPIDVKDIGCDAFYSSPHKWLLAPPGNGMLYIRSDVVSDIWTTLASAQWDNHEDDGYRLTQRGTGNPSLLAGLDAAIEFHHGIGAKKVTDRIKYLGDYLRNELQKIDKVEIKSSTHPDMCAGITTYTITGLKGSFIQSEMWKRRKLQPRSVGDDVGIRHSVHIYNSLEEIDAAIVIVRDLAKTA